MVDGWGYAPVTLVRILQLSKNLSGIPVGVSGLITPVIQNFKVGYVVKGRFFTSSFWKGESLRRENKKRHDTKITLLHSFLGRRTLPNAETTQQ